MLNHPTLEKLRTLHLTGMADAFALLWRLGLVFKGQYVYAHAHVFMAHTSCLYCARNLVYVCTHLSLCMHAYERLHARI